MSSTNTTLVHLKLQSPVNGSECPKVESGSFQTRQRHILVTSFVLCVVMPSVLGVLYFLFVASDRYVASAGFAVRSMDANVGGDVFGTFTGIANAGNTTSDSYILLRYIKSRSIVEKLEKDFPFRKAYASDALDFISHLDARSDIEHVVAYWGDMIQTSYDNISGIITFRVSAFRPDDARQVANLLLRYSKELVNDLSENARVDAVSFAKSEVVRAETRLRHASDSLRSFRDNEKSIDPTKTAQVQIEIVGGLEKELAETRARISALVGIVEEGSPSLRQLKRKAEALAQEIALKRAEAVNNNVSGAIPNSALSELLAKYGALDVERNFAQQSYVSALSSLEKAYVEAGRRQRYLAIFETPLLPEYPLYPKRISNSIMLLLVLTGLWGIAVLMVYSVRDHLL